MTELAEKMIRYRALHNMSQGDLAEKCQVSRQTIYNLESDLQTPSKVTLMKILIGIGESNDAGKYLKY